MPKWVYVCGLIVCLCYLRYTAYSWLALTMGLSACSKCVKESEPRRVTIHGPTSCCTTILCIFNHHPIFPILPDQIVKHVIFTFLSCGN